MKWEFMALPQLHSRGEQRARIVAARTEKKKREKEKGNEIEKQKKKKEKEKEAQGQRDGGGRFADRRPRFASLVELLINNPTHTHTHILVPGKCGQQWSQIF